MTLADRLMPALRCLDPETAHSLALMALSLGLAPPVAAVPRPILKTRV